MKKENKTIKQMEAYTKPVIGIHKVAAEKGFANTNLDGKDPDGYAPVSGGVKW